MAMAMAVAVAPCLPVGKCFRKGPKHACSGSRSLAAPRSRSSGSASGPATSCCFYRLFSVDAASLTQWAADVKIKMCVTARYRLAELDERLTVQRVTAEARCVARCRRAGVPAPALLLLDARQRTLYLEVAVGHLVVLGGNLGVSWR